MQSHSSAVNCILILVSEQLLISEWPSLIYLQTWPRSWEVLLLFLILPLDCGIISERMALLCLFKNKNIMHFSSKYCRFKAFLLQFAVNMAWVKLFCSAHHSSVSSLVVGSALPGVWADFPWSSLNCFDTRDTLQSSCRWYFPGLSFLPW